MRKQRTAAALLAAVLGLGVVSAMPAALAAEPTTEGLVLHYPFSGDGGTVAEDASGHDRDGQILGGAQPGPNGLELDGVNDYVRLPNNIMSGLSSITVAFDVRIDPSMGSAYFIYGLGNSSGANGNGYLFAEGNPLRTTIASGNWSTEQNTQANGYNLPRNVWKHLTYTQTGTTGILYEDGREVARNTAVTITPGSIGNGTTTANYIGRSLYSADPYLKGAVQDFRIYDRALSAGEVADLSAANAQPVVDADAAALTLGDTSAITADLTLPATTPGGSAVTWATSDAGVVTAQGVVTRPAAGTAARTATLTATVSQRGASAQRSFTVTVVPVGSDQERAQAAAAALVVHDVDDVRGNLHLPTTGPDGSTVTWASSDASVITATGEVNRPAAGQAAAEVALTATVSVGAATVTRVFDAHVPALPAPADYEGYLFSHFLGEGLEHGEQVYFALSEGNDPLRYTNLNGGQPVMVSTSGEMGLRDPFIIRSPEGDKFYQIATDLRMWRNSSGSWDEVQRQGSRNIVVWESTDLVNWSESWVAEVAPENAGNAWAPEIFYDDERGEYVVFWASKLYAEDDPNHTGNAYNQMLFATTRDFRTFSEPETLIDYGYSVIDTTMIEHDGEVYRFSKNEANRSATNPGGKHVFQEVGSGPTADDFELVRSGVGAGTPPAGLNQGEGPTVFKSNTEERWYLFIDEYGGRGYVPLTTTDLASGEWTVLGSGEYSFPSRFRHGTVLPVTGAEWEALQIAYGTPDASAVAQDLQALAIPNADDVRGNITLPTEGAEGTTFTWASSDAGVVTTTGEVTRPAYGEDPVEVTLTVTATKGAVVRTRTFTLTVQPMPQVEETEAYFFPHFKGESTPRGEQIYFAASRGNDALSWIPLNDDEEVLSSTMGEQGLRDPFIIRSHEGDRFFLLATDLKTYRPGQGPDFARAQQTGSRSLMIWESTDLVDWGEPRLVEVNLPTAGNTWAPEAHYVESIGQYAVYWASNLYPEDVAPGDRRTNDSYNRMMISFTRDFVTFTEPEVWIDIRRQPGRGMIDSTVVEHDGMYYRFTKDERNDIMEVLLERSPDLLRPQTGAVGTSWELITERIGSGDPLRHAEGPTAFRANEGDVNITPGQDTWFLFQDWPPYGGGEGYVAFSCTDLDDGDCWTHEPGLDLSARHGTVLPITAAEHERLLRAYQPDALGPEVSVEADTRCVAGKVVQTVRVTNESGAPVDVAVSSSWGSRSVTIGADRATSLTFSTRAASVAAGEVSVTATADGSSRTVTAPHAARTCR
ncbi:immunoglobulin-like domain-containing protein [Georgenia faecalis]|uniref:Immunoglobulin-like domain-containing protein n=1 Tax=Georgenia faecalis TaxID=2483799 RepID=A0ABV9D8F1_9MICO|nr:immunoglobulin-like domain-containing protein [Georgenia faecalis]